MLATNLAVLDGKVCRGKLRYREKMVLMEGNKGIRSKEIGKPW